MIKLLTCSLIHLLDPRVQSLILFLKDAVPLLGLADLALLVAAALLELVALGLELGGLVSKALTLFHKGFSQFILGLDVAVDNFELFFLYQRNSVLEGLDFGVKVRVGLRILEGLVLQGGASLRQDLLQTGNLAVLLAQFDLVFSFGRDNL